MYSLNPLFSSRVPGSVFTQEQLDQIKDYVDKGFKIKDIIELTGVSRSALNKRIKNNNWIASTTQKRSHHLSQQELNEIKEKYQKGCSVSDLAKEYNVSKNNLHRRISNNKWEERTKRKTKYSCDETFFDIIDTEHKAYWLGFLYADGYILSKRGVNEQQSFGFSININDIELFEKFKADLKSNHPVNIYKASRESFENGSDYGRILITSQHMVDCLKSYGMVEHKTTILKMPELREDLIPHFIRGYSDGDGSIVISHLKSGEIKYFWDITSTKEICEAILNYIGKNNLKLYQRHPERDVNNYTMRICGKQQTPKILSKIYDNATIYLERKYKKYAEMRGINV